MQDHPLLSCVVVAKCDAEAAYSLGMLADEARDVESEFILVDDSADCGCWEALKRLRVAYPSRHCSYLATRGRGGGEALNAGWRSARGDFVVLAEAGCDLLAGGLTAALERADPETGALSSRDGRLWLCRRTALRDTGGFERGARQLESAFDHLRVALADAGWGLGSLEVEQPGAAHRAPTGRPAAAGPAYWLAAILGILAWSPGQPGPATVVNRTVWRG